MNILFEEFPDSVCVNGENYQIETDFREWIRFIQLVEDDEVPWQIKCQLMMQWYTEHASCFSRWNINCYRYNFRSYKAIAI